MTVPTETAIDYSDLPNRLSLLPLEDGDFGLILHVVEQGRYIHIMPLPLGDIGPEQVARLIHLAPISTDTPDDLVEQFRKQLEGDGTE